MGGATSALPVSGARVSQKVAPGSEFSLPGNEGTTAPGAISLKGSCSPSDNMYFLISLKWDFGFNLSEYKQITNYNDFFF